MTCCFCKILLAALFLPPLEEIFNVYHLVLVSGQVPERDDWLCPPTPTAGSLCPARDSFPYMIGNRNVHSFSRSAALPLQGLVLWPPQDQSAPGLALQPHKTDVQGGEGFWHWAPRRVSQDQTQNAFLGHSSHPFCVYSILASDGILSAPLKKLKISKSAIIIKQSLM